jgi:hypothetical protein
MRNLIDEPSHQGAARHMRALIEAWMEDTDYPGLRLYQQSRMGKLDWSVTPGRLGRL